MLDRIDLLEDKLSRRQEVGGGDFKYDYEGEEREAIIKELTKLYNS